jgi:hypothetical protein
MLALTGVFYKRAGDNARARLTSTPALEPAAHDASAAHTPARVAKS